MNRIKTITFIITLLTFTTYSWNVFCQSTGILTKAPFIGVQNIVRYDAVSGNHIACSHPGGTTIHFQETNLSAIFDIEVATNAIVKDFEIIDRYVFFCGQDIASISGFIGWFHIDSLFHLGGSVHIDRTLSALNVLSLDNIEVYQKDDRDYYIAGYGSSSIPGYLAFESYGHPSTGMQYRTLQLEYDNYNFPIDDIAVTDNYVVYMCAYRSNAYVTDCGYGITLYPFPKFDMFQTPYYPGYFFQTIVVSTYGSLYYLESNEPFSNSSPKMVPLDNDIITVAAHRRKIDFLGCYPNSSSDPFICMKNYVSTSLTFRTYDISPISSSQPITMISANEVQLYDNTGISSGPTMTDFVYDPVSENYLVLHKHFLSASVYDYAVTSLDIPTLTATSEYQTAFSTTSVWAPCSMCLDNSSKYTVSGYDNYSSTWEYYFWQNQVGGPDGDCHITVPNAVNVLPTMLHKDMTNPHTPSSWTPLTFVAENPQPYQQEKCTIICK